MKKEFEIYTDGACIGNGKKKNIGGWSFVFVNKNQVFYESVGVVFDTTNNRQEILGVLNALRCCKEHGITSFVIFSDSQYVVNGINDWMDGWKKKGWMKGRPAQPVANRDLWEEVYAIKSEFVEVDIRWVRGHNGNRWNERADELINLEMEKQSSKV